MIIYLAEIDAYNPASSGVDTLRFCTGIGFTTKPTETPANTLYTPRLLQPGSFKQSMFANGSTSGNTTIGYGEIVIVNIDGAFDYLVDYGFDGRKVVIRRGEDTGNYPNDFSIVYTATIEQPIFTTNKVAFKLKGKEFLLEKSVQTLKFAGDNALPDGLEGVATDIKGKVKPMVIGKVYNASPVCVNTTKLIYAVNIRKITLFDSIDDVDTVPDFDAITSTMSVRTGIQSGNGIVAVYDKGVALTRGTEYTTEEDMMQNAPAAGFFRVWPLGGYFRIGSSPTGTITIDCRDGGTGAINSHTVGTLLNNLLKEEGGLQEADIDQNDITDIIVANSSAVGVFLQDETTLKTVIDSFCKSVGAWWGFDRLGIFRIKQIKLPLGTPDIYLTQNNILSCERLPFADTQNGLPAKRLIMKWRKNHTVQKTNDVASSVTDARKNELAIEYRETEAKDDAVLIKHPLASDIIVESAFYDEPTTEATRQYNLYKVRRDRFLCRVPLNITNSEKLLDLGNVVNITYNRFGLESGKSLMIIDSSLNCSQNVVDLTLWG